MKAIYKQVKRITVEPLRGENMEFVIDGEVYNTPKIEVEIKPRALKLWEI